MGGKTCNEILADAVLLLHAAFALFVLAGGLLVLKWRRMMWVHVPAALWGIAVEFGGWICPLTPLENRLRAAAGELPYQGDFIAHYLQGALYPSELTRTMQVLLGLAVIAVNGAVYAFALRNRRCDGGGPERSLKRRAPS